MLFNSYIFVLGFLPIVFGSFFIVARWDRRIAATLLVVASLVFYGWLDARFVLLLLLSITFNYGLGRLIFAHAGIRGVLLGFAVAVDLAVLGIFKYANFFIDVANSSGLQIAALNVVLPLGISFFTFTQIAFLVDVRRGLAKEFDFIHYCLFVTWFPHLVAGPILHHSQMMSQFAERKTYSIQSDAVAAGLTQFTIGLFKKVILADYFAIDAGSIFDSTAHGATPTFFDAWIGALAYTLQLYFDFSGYSDMALGLSQLFGIRLPLNFNSPYKSRSIIDFWRRWHISLSTFLRDYLYLPLGGNRKGETRRFVNLIVTMVLGGLWHGAGWTFIVWGALHAAYLVINHGWRHITRGLERPTSWLIDTSKLLLTFASVVVAWVAFRAADMPTAIKMWRGLFGGNGISLPVVVAQRLPTAIATHVDGRGFAPLLPTTIWEAAVALAIGLILIWRFPNTQQILLAYQPAYDIGALRPPIRRWQWTPTRANAVLFGLMGGVCILLFRRNSPFLYFQF